MPDFQNLTITEQAPVQVTVPRLTISCQVVHSVTGVVQNDFTGVNTFEFPLVLASLTAAQRARFWHQTIKHLILMRAGQA
jgi:hypothetical protein